MDLDAYRRSAEAFAAELTGEYYRHYAGLETTYEIEPIYERHAELFTAEAVDALREQAGRGRAGQRGPAAAARCCSTSPSRGTWGEATKALESRARAARGAR